MTFLEDKQSLRLAAARKIAEAAEAFAAGKGWNISIAVVDEGGNLMYVQRMDGAIIGSVPIAEQKARTAVTFKCPTKDLQSGVEAGALSLLKLDILPFEGGIPIVVNGQIVGAVGVSGNSASGDGQVAQAGADWCKDGLSQ
jgi:glc operon protein GlcG